LHTSHSIHSPCLSIPTAITINYTLSLHDALPISTKGSKGAWRRPKTSSSSKYKGVSWNKKQKKWNAVMNINGGTVFLGSFYKEEDRKSTRLNSSHVSISYAVFCLKKKKNTYTNDT